MFNNLNLYILSYFNFKNSNYNYDFIVSSNTNKIYSFASPNENDFFFDPLFAIIQFFPELFLANSILMFTIFGIILSTTFLPSNKDKDKHFFLLTNLFHNITLYIIFLTFILQCIDIPILSFFYDKTSICENLFIIDILSQNVKKISLIFIFFILLISKKLIFEQKINIFENYIIILCLVFNLLILASVNDFLSLYLTLEGLSLSSYFLASIKNNSFSSIEGALKYFISGSFSSVLLLYGISIIYLISGTTNYEDLIFLFSNSFFFSNFLGFNTLGFAFIFISIVFFFKIGAVPFHMWMIDTYEGAPTISTIIFAILPKFVIFTTFARIFQPLFSTFEYLFIFIFLTTSILSVFIGSFLAFRQTKLKRLLAFSAVSHTGYLLLAFTANSLESLQAMFFYLIIYMLTSLGIWCIMLSLNTKTNKFKSKTISDLAYISTTNPAIGFATIILFFSLAGIPPFIGFFAKINLFISAINSSFYFSSILIIFSSLISAFFYVRLIKNIFFEKIKKNEDMLPINYSISIVLSGIIILLILFSINPKFLLLLTEEMALSILN